jgi:hypothetical protein
MSTDIRDILTRLDHINEGALTPAGERHGLNPQQKSVDQLPALFRPRSIRALASKRDPQHPMAGKFVGDSKKNTGTALEEAMAEIEEDMLSKVKRDLTTYLDKLEKKARVDRELKQKAVDAVMHGRAEEDRVEEDPTAIDPTATAPTTPVQDPVMPESAPVKTINMEDDVMLEIHGDQSMGFEIRRDGRSMLTRFPDIDQAQMAIDLFRARRKRSTRDQDYIEER